MNDLDAMYQQIILDAARERHGEGELAEFDGESFQVNTTCGDQVNLQVRLSPASAGPATSTVTSIAAQARRRRPRLMAAPVRRCAGAILPARPGPALE